jgi:threonine dehydrogenase-like Zn-dependent dehydrogenase
VAVKAALESLRRKGVMVQVGLTGSEMTIPYALLPQRELSIRGTFGHNWSSWERGIELVLSGQVRVKPLISGVYPLDQWEEAFASAEGQLGVKVLIHPNV